MPSTIIVFSHLRWDFVYQRPQQLLARLAAKHRIIFFEEPILDKGSDAFIETSAPEPGVLVCKPHTPSFRTGTYDEQIPILRKLLNDLIRDQKLTEYIVWFYTPMALPLLRGLKPKLVVYDCMDEHSGFLNAPSQMVQRERELLKVADLVFTGGPSLYEAKKGLNHSVHCFSSSVDTDHFSQAKDPQIEHPAQRSLPRPRLGFFGVLDERLDVALLNALAKAHQDWQLILVGPVVKIAPDTLPNGKNIHYFGKQEYSDLPSFMAGWDVCLLPFALNDATRFISPTKTLEYMAAEKPVVSTPITDVARPYGKIVTIADSAESFIRACEEALLLTPEKRSSMQSAMRSVLSHTSWDATVQRMDQLVEEALVKKRRFQQLRNKLSTRSVHGLPTATAAALLPLPDGAVSGPVGRQSPSGIPPARRILPPVPLQPQAELPGRHRAGGKDLRQ